MGTYLKSHETWSPRHYCRPWSIRNNLPDRLKDGESAMHLASFLADPSEDENNSQEMDNVHETQYGETGVNVEKFDLYHVKEDNMVDDYEQGSVAAAIEIQHISLATNPEPFNHGEYHFLPDEENLSLSLVALK